jgi:hypothetical protein
MSTIEEAIKVLQDSGLLDFDDELSIANLHTPQAEKVYKKVDAFIEHYKKFWKRKSYDFCILSYHIKAYTGIKDPYKNDKNFYPILCALVMNGYHLECNASKDISILNRRITVFPPHKNEVYK